jgi:FtsH-binding integral membrane protein
MTTSIYRSADQINTAMARVFGHMSLATLTSMVVAMLVASSPALMAVLFGTALKWVVLFAPLLMVFMLPPILNSNPPKMVAWVCLHSFAGVMGLMLSAVMHTYTTTSLVTAFMGAAVLFGTTAIYGYFTKRDLTGFGQLLFVALIAIIIASIINIFIGSTVTQMVISAISIVVFMGLTAYDTQSIRNMVSTDSNDGVEVLGALSLYLNFVNIFLSLLNLFGDKSD